MINRRTEVSLTTLDEAGLSRTTRLSLKKLLIVAERIEIGRFVVDPHAVHVLLKENPKNVT